MSKKIIIADDDKSFLMYICLLLKRFGFEIFPAENGFEVLKLTKMTGVDVVMLDVHIRKLDGITVLMYLKENKITSHIPVIMLSSDPSKETIEKCKSLGCFEYLIKPVKLDELHETLQNCLFYRIGIRRKHLRAACNMKVIVNKNGTQHDLYAETLSIGGIYIRKEDPFPVGSKVVVTLPLEDKISMSMEGEVIYIKEIYGDFLRLSPGMAIEFKGLKEDDYKTLKTYVENLIAGDILEDKEGELIER